MASSQDAQNVFYGRKILSRPKCKPYTGVLMPGLRRSVSRDAHRSHICPPICLHTPYGTWGFCCMSMSPQRGWSCRCTCDAVCSAAVVRRWKSTSPWRPTVQGTGVCPRQRRWNDKCCVVTALAGQHTGLYKRTVSRGLYLK